MKLVLVFLKISFLFLMPFALANFQEDSQLYQKAVGAYYEKDYKVAESSFLDLLKLYPDNAFLMYNLGTIYLTQGEKGHALQYYEKARRFKPRIVELDTNLQLAKPQNNEGEGFLSYLLSTFYFWQKILTVSEYGMIVLCLALLFWTYVFMRFFRRKKIITASFLLFLGMFVYVSYGYVLKSKHDAMLVYGVVLTKTLPVRPSYLDTEAYVFELQEGTIVKVIDEQKISDRMWWRIELPKGQKGWVMAQDVGMI